MFYLVKWRRERWGKVITISTLFSRQARSFWLLLSVFTAPQHAKDQGGSRGLGLTHNTLDSHPLVSLGLSLFAAFPSLPFCNLKGPRPYKTVVNCTKTLASSPSLQANYFLIPVMSPKMLIYAEVNLHEWAQPRGQTHPSWVKLFPGWQEKSGRDVGGSHLSFLLPSQLSSLYLIADCQDDQSETQAWWRAYCWLQICWRICA